tara:strand:+ start:1401 stop:1631 length:231 start_codon:yes stop_codon:yes gene_type:complete
MEEMEKEDLLTEEQRLWVLSLSLEYKINTIREMRKEGLDSLAIGLCKLLLDAPISEGGVSSETLTKIMEEDINEPI